MEEINHEIKNEPVNEQSDDWRRKIIDEGF